MITRRRRGQRAGSSAVTSIAFQASATSDSQTIICPTIVAGDLLVLFDQAVSTSGTPTNAIPSGFTQIKTSTGGLSRISRITLSYKLATGAETGASLSGMTGGLSIAKVMLVFRPVGVISTVTASTFLEEITDSNPSPRLIAASGQPSPLIRIGSAALATAGSAPSFSAGTFDATVAKDGLGGGGIRAGYAIQNSSPSNDSPDLADNGGGNCLVTGWLRFS